MSHRTKATELLHWAGDLLDVGCSADDLDAIADVLREAAEGMADNPRAGPRLALLAMSSAAVAHLAATDPDRLPDEALALLHDLPAPPVNF